MKHILLPTDFSENAFNAILTALKLYSKEACNFILLHAYEPRIENVMGAKSTERAGLVYQAMAQEAQKKLAETLEEIQKVSHSTEHTFSPLARKGNVAGVVQDLVSEYDLDLIVMGTKGATGAKQLFLGSNTVNTLKKVRECPVLAVPKKFNFQRLRKVVFPTEYAHFFSKGQLHPLLEMVRLWNAKLLVLHVAQEFQLSERQMAHKNLLKERFDTLDYSFHELTIHTTVANAITDFAETNSADMVCLVHYDHTFMEKLTQEPVVKKVGFHTKIPLLVLPA